MATNPIGGIAAPVTLPGTLPPMPALARVLGQFDSNKLGAAIEVMIALLDAAEPDPEAEAYTWPEDVRAGRSSSLPEDSEAAGDEADTSWPEWHQRSSRTTWAGHEMAGARGLGECEDDEQDDEPEEDDHSGQCDEDGINTTGIVMFGGYGAGCPISDPGGCEHDGREPEHMMD